MNKIVRAQIKSFRETFPDMTKENLNKAFTFIEKLTYLDKVQLSQQKVLEAKDKLQEVGEAKTAIHRELSTSRKLFDEIKEDIRTTNRFHDKQVELWKQEKDLAVSITQLEQKLIEVDDRERQLFVSLTTSLNTSYEAEKLHSNSLKVWGLVGTCTASVFTFIISLIGYYFHNNRLGSMSKEFHDSIEAVHEQISAFQTEVMRNLENQNTQLKIASISNKENVSETWGHWFKRQGRSWYYWCTFQKE